MVSVKSILILTVGLVLSYYSGQVLWLEYKVKQWPRAEGIISSVEVKIKETEIKDSQYRPPEVLYSYEVQGNTYNASKVGLDPPILDELRQLFGDGYPQQRYKVGQIILVYYNPSIPGEAVIRNNVSTLVYFTFFAGVLLIFVSSLTMLTTREEEQY